jgi:hypothetical protein
MEGMAGDLSTNRDMDGRMDGQQNNGNRKNHTLIIVANHFHQGVCIMGVYLVINLPVFSVPVLGGRESRFLSLI